MLIGALGSKLEMLFSALIQIKSGFSVLIQQLGAFCSNSKFESFLFQLKNFDFSFVISKFGCCSLKLKKGCFSVFFLLDILAL